MDRTQHPTETELLALIEQANASDVDSQLYLAWAYGQEGIFKQNNQEVEKWLDMAARSGSTVARRQLTSFLVAQGKTDAILNAEQLAAQNDFWGHFMLGKIYLFGLCGAPMQRQLAISHLNAAAELGHIVSEMMLHRERLARAPRKLKSLLSLLSSVSAYVRMSVREPNNPRVLS